MQRLANKRIPWIVDRSRFAHHECGRGLAARFLRAEQFCTVLQRRVSDAVKGSKEQFSRQSVDGLPTLLRRPHFGPRYRESRPIRWPARAETGAVLAYRGHLPTENRNGLVV